MRGVNLTPRTLLATSRLELALTEKARSIISAMRAAGRGPQPGSVPGGHGSGEQDPLHLALLLGRESGGPPGEKRTRRASSPSRSPRCRQLITELGAQPAIHGRGRLYEARTFCSHSTMVG